MGGKDKGERDFDEWRSRVWREGEVMSSGEVRSEERNRGVEQCGGAV